MKSLKRIIGNDKGHGMVFPIELILGLATSAALVIVSIIYGLYHLVRFITKKRREY